MSKPHNLLGLIILVAFLSGCGASSPTSPAQIPTSIEMSIGTSATIIADISAEIEESLSVAGAVTCSSAMPGDGGVSQVCATPTGVTLGIMKVDMGSCGAVACTLSGVKVSSPSGSAISYQDIYVAANNTSTTVEGKIRSVQIDRTGTAVSVPGTESITTEGQYSFGRAKVAFIRQVLSSDAVFGDLRSKSAMVCTMDNGCVQGSDFNTQSTLSVISGTIRGDILIDNDNTGVYQWYDRNAKVLTSTRPSLPLTNSVIANNSGDVMMLDSSDGAFLIPMFNSDQSLLASIALASTYTYSWDANIYASFAFVDVNADGMYSMSTDMLNLFWPLSNILTFTKQ